LPSSPEASASASFGQPSRRVWKGHDGAGIRALADRHKQTPPGPHV
jgi:hypothetical protein